MQKDVKVLGLGMLGNIVQNIVDQFLPYNVLSSLVFPEHLLNNLFLTLFQHVVAEQEFPRLFDLVVKITKHLLFNELTHFPMIFFLVLFPHQSVLMFVCFYNIFLDKFAEK